MKMGRFGTGFLMALLLVCCPLSIFAQENTVQMPEAVRMAVVGQQAEVPNAVRDAIVGKSGEYVPVPETVAPRKKKVPVCRNAEMIAGTKLVPVPKMGSVRAYSTLIVRGDTVEGYWKEYSAIASREITAKGAYLAAVTYLNPQISNLDEICKDSIIRLPYARRTEQTLPPTAGAKDSRDEEIVFLQGRVLSLEDRARIQAETLKNHERLIAEAKQTLLVIPSLQNEITTLRQTVESKDATIVTLHSELTAVERQVALRGTTTALLVIVILALGGGLIVALVRGRGKSGRASKNLPKIEVVAPRHVSKETREQRSVQAAKTLDYTDVPRGHMKFSYHGKEVILRAYEVLAPCGTQVEIGNMASHRLKCASKACAVFATTTSSVVPLGSMIYEQSDGRREVIKVVSAFAECGENIKVRNMQSHITNCTSEKCVEMCAAATTLAGAEV